MCILVGNMVYTGGFIVRVRGCIPQSQVGYTLVDERAILDEVVSTLVDERAILKCFILVDESVYLSEYTCW